MTTLRRLNELLDQKDIELSETKDKLQEARSALEADMTWTRHREVTKDEYPELPVPRLQMTWIEKFFPLRSENDKKVFSHWYVEYGLVYKLFHGDLVLVPLGGTTIRGQRGMGPLEESGVEGEIRVPFRDGTNIVHDAITLDLPAFVCWEKHVFDLEDRILQRKSKKYNG